jgi:hypothetical protein
MLDTKCLQRELCSKIKSVSRDEQYHPEGAVPEAIEGHQA